MPYAPNETWDLASVFAGGPGGAPFLKEVEALGAEIAALTPRADAVPANVDAAGLAEILLALEHVAERIEQMGTFAGCAAA
ncbi:MAG: hypothetical protein ACK4YP_26815, partial [Myxococcota bacterium]